MARAPADTVTARDVASLLASTLGWEKSLSLVVETARVLGYGEDGLTHEQMLAVLDQLGREGGIVGVAARFARRRAEGPYARPLEAAAATAASKTLPPPGPEEEPPSRTAPSSSGPEQSAVFMSVPALAELLARTLGQEKGEEVLAASARRHGFRPDRLGREEAERIFEELAGQEGLVGIAARFAKARLVLKFSAAR